MAAGDAAAAAGFPVVAPTDDVRKGYEDINTTRDLVAAERTRVQPVAQGGTGGTNASTARDGIGAASKALDNLVMNDAQKSSLRGYLRINSDEVSSRGANGSGSESVQRTLEYLNTRSTTGINDANNAWNRAGDADATAVAARQGNLWTDSYNRNVSGQSVRVAYLGNTGQLGYSPSSRRYKENIEAYDISDEVMAGIELVVFDYIGADEGSPSEVGFIAENLDALGLSFLTFRNRDGEIEGVHYDRVALALIPTIQRLMARVAELEAAAPTPEEA